MADDPAERDAERQRIERLLDSHRSSAHEDGLDAEDAARALFREHVDAHGPEGATAGLEALYELICDEDDGFVNLGDDATLVVRGAIERAEEASTAWAEGEDVYSEPEVRPGDQLEADERRFLAKRRDDFQRAARRVHRAEHGRTPPATLSMPVATARQRGPRPRPARTSSSTRSSSRGDGDGDGDSGPSPGDGDEPPSPERWSAHPLGDLLGGST